MGTFIFELGEPSIPEENRGAFFEDAKKIASQGGLFSRSHISVFGKNIILLGEPEIDDDEDYLDYTYSYYEKDSWENAGIWKKDCRPYSNKVGWKQFNQAVQALHILAELYSETPYLSLNDSRNRPVETIQWLRHVLKRELHYSWRNHIWEAMEMEAKREAEYCDDPVVRRDFVFSVAGDESDQMELLDAVFVASGLKEFISEEEREKAPHREDGTISFSYALITLYDEVAAFKASSSLPEDEQVEFLFQFLKGFNAQKDKELLEKYARIAIMTVVLTPQMSVKVIAEVYGKNFWNLWWEVKGDIKIERDPPAGEPLAAIPYREMSTEEFFGIDAADRLYWWDQDADVVIPDEIKTWLRKLQQRYAALYKSVSPDISAWQKRFVGLLAKNANAYCFEQMFFEFMGHFHEEMYCGAVMLLEECAANQVEYRRLLAVMANRKLRYGIFFF